jgi:hypothetical protein
MTTHRSTIKCNGNTALAKHFTKCTQPTPQMQISILDDSPDNANNPIKIKEASWMGRLASINKGINERDETYQVLNQHTMPITSHFNHSKTCWPHFTHKLVTTVQDDMSRFKRVIINKLHRKRLPTHRE